MKKDKLLRTYLNDHLAGAEAGLQLAKDCLAHNRSGPLGAFLPELIVEIEKDHEVLKDLYARLSSSENPLKKTMSWMLSKMSRLKLESLFLEYSDLTRLEELEGLALGIRGKLLLWKAFEEACGSDDRFSDVDFEKLQQRARRQYEQVESHRVEAARTAFSSSSS